jgi:hypothetical protein
MTTRRSSCVAVWILLVSLQGTAVAATAARTATAPSAAIAGSAATFPIPLLDAAGTPLPSGVLTAPRTSETAAPTPPVDLPLEIVAQIYPCLYQQIAFGDTDHDGHNEAILYVNDDSTFHYRILEEEGNDVYSDEYSGDSLVPYATGDLDGDGKSELIGQFGAYVYVYEATDDHSYPTRLAWVSPPISNVVGYTAIGDTDRDGRQEIIQSLNPFTGNSELFIFENTGDDAYTQVYHTVVGPGANGEKVIADLDGDGRTEIAFCGLDGVIYVYEARADNVWGLTWTQSTGLTNAYGAEGGMDTDGDGRPELFIMGNGPGGWTTLIYEATGDNQFDLIATLAMDDGYIGLCCNALGNLDGSGTQMYLMQGERHFWIYAPASPGHWEMIQQYDNPPSDNHFGLQTHDVNNNGTDEVFYDIETSIQYGWRTWVLEHPVNPTGVPGPGVESAAGLRVWPNPCPAGQAFWAAPGSPSVTRLKIFGAGGREVARIGYPGDGPVRVDAGRFRSGVYLIAGVDAKGSVSSAARFIVIR